jgi:hypothetical protein
MDEMLKAIHIEFNLDTEDLSTLEVEQFFRLLKPLEELLHRHMKVTLLTFVTWLMNIKFKFSFFNNCYNKLPKLIGDVLSKPNKLPKDVPFQ